MVRGKFKYFASVLVLSTCLALSNISQAANLIKTDGVAVITSKLDKKLFRTRAIENALQNLVSQGSQTVDSFSIIENGKVLLDQVHLASKLGIQEYSVIKEEIKGKLYHVSLNVVVNDKQDKETNKICRRAVPPSMDLSVNIEIEKNKLPPWALFSDDFINRAIENHEFEPSLKNPSSQNETQLKAAEIANEGITLEYDTGNKRTILEVIQSRTLLLDARTSYARAQKDFAIAQFNLLASIGDLYLENIK